jgi:hypothetical protein
MLQVRTFRNANGTWDLNRWYVCLVRPWGELRYIDANGEPNRDAVYFPTKQLAQQAKDKYLNSRR